MRILFIKNSSYSLHDAYSEQSSIHSSLLSATCLKTELGAGKGAVGSHFDRASGFVPLLLAK